MFQQWTISTKAEIVNVIRLLQNLSNAIRRTFCDISTDTRVARSLGFLSLRYLLNTSKNQPTAPTIRLTSMGNNYSASRNCWQRADKSASGLWASWTVGKMSTAVSACRQGIKVRLSAFSLVHTGTQFDARQHSMMIVWHLSLRLNK